jgi:hypothetical protein
VHPLSVIDDVRNLNNTPGFDLPKNSKEKGNVLYYKLDLVDVNAISDIIWVLNEDENERAKKFLHRACNGKRHGSNTAPQRCQARRDCDIEEGNCSY